MFITSMCVRSAWFTAAALGSLAILTAPLHAGAPKVTRTLPAADATDVDPALSEVVITFDTAMKPDGWSLVQVGEAAFPEFIGDEPIAFRDDRTCMVKVKLAPGTAYSLGINSRTRQGFKSADGTPLEPFVLSFKTGTGAPPTAPDGPRLVKSDPPDGAKDVEPGTFDLTLVFGEPMKSGQASISTPPEGPRLQVVGKTSWKDSRTLVVPVVLAPGTTYRVGVNTGENRRFVSAGDGTPAVSREITFTTAGKLSDRAASRPAEALPVGARGPVPLRYDYRKGDRYRIAQTAAIDLKIQAGSQTLRMGQDSQLDAVEEVSAADKGRPVEVRKRIEKYSLGIQNPQTGQRDRSEPLTSPVTVRIDRRGETPDVESVEGEVPEALMKILAEDLFLDLLPPRSVKVGDRFEVPETTREKVKQALGKGEGEVELRLTCRKIGPVEIQGASDGRARNEATRLMAAEMALEWKQEGVMEGGVPFSLSANGVILFATEAGILLRLSVDGKITVKPLRTVDAQGQPLTVTGSGTYKSEYKVEPIAWKRGVLGAAPVVTIQPAATRAAQDDLVGPPAPPAEARTDQAPTPAPGVETAEDAPAVARQQVDAADEGPAREEKPPTEQALIAPKPPAGWTLMDDKVFGSQVAVPPGWTPRVRGDVALCVEPDATPKSAAFFVPMLLKGQARPEELADGFDEMLKRGVPDLQTRTSGRPTPDSVQRDLTMTSGGVPLVGAYRAIVAKSGMGLVMGYAAPRDVAGKLKPDFHRVLASFRYTGPRERLQPFKSAAIELRIPQGWSVRTSEGKDADQDVDWEVLASRVPGARAYMYSPKYFTPSWITDALTGQVDPQLLTFWRNRGYEMAAFPTDDQALRAALESALPGLQIVRQQSLDEIRDAFRKAMEIPVQTAQATGGRFTIHVYEVFGRRTVQGVEMRSVTGVALGALVIPGGIKGTVAIWWSGLRGFEAPADRFAQVAPVLDRVTSSFSYTLWWIREVMKANEEQSRTLRKFYADMNRLDREIFDNRVKTNSAITEMMYDTLTENHGYVNQKTGTVEKIPTDRLENFRLPGGDIVSPEEVIDRHVDPQSATRLREASADDYMSFDRRAQVWP